MQLQLRYLNLRLNPLLRSLRATKHISARVVNNRITISSNNKFIYYRVPKAANSTIMYNLVFHDPHHEVDAQNYNRQWAKQEAYYKPRDYGIKKSKQILDDYFLFTFVRNPYDRVLSAYLNKIVNPKKKNMIAKAIGKSLDKEVNFEDFIKYLNHGGLYGNIHWAPQSSFLLPNDNFDFIGNVESLDEDLQRILPQIFPHLTEFYTDKETSNITYATKKRESYYTNELMHIVRNLYHEDFERFDYKDHL